MPTCLVALNVCIVCVCVILFCQGFVYVCHLSWILSNNLFMYTLANTHSQTLTRMTQL
jgi:hypothetical protein